MSINQNYIDSLDKNDNLSSFKNDFLHAKDNICYLDGNSLGRLPKKTISVVSSFLKDEWGGHLVEGWDQWINEAQVSGNFLADSVLGADIGTVLVCDTTSINFYQLCSSVVMSSPDRKTIITDAANFPTDRYILEGIANIFNLNLIIIDNDSVDDDNYEIISPKILEKYLSDDVSLVTFQVLQYRSGALNPVKDITRLARSYGALTVWDASHAAGSVKLAFKENSIDLAVGCTYKYLCSGPGSPAWLYVSKDLQEKLNVPIQGWFAQKNQFDMEPVFNRTKNIRGFQISSPSLIGLRSVNVSCEIYRSAKMDNIINKAHTGTELMIDLYDQWLKELGFKLMTPRDSLKRGCHISLMHEYAKKISRALRKFDRVIVDYRTPNQIRIAISPLYNTYNEVYNGFKKIKKCVESEKYLDIRDESSKVT
tara:strand:- start:599 stop:1870 length:1272 start_codon:yes stop_codon:yes gene_type:complete